MERKTAMLKNAIWNSVGSVFYSVCQWLLTILVVYLGSYKAAGQLSLAMTTSSAFSAISLFSMRNFQVSDIRGEYSGSEYVSSRVITCLLALVCCGISSVFGNSAYQFWCIIAFMCIRVAEALVDVLHGINQKYERYDYIGQSYILRGIITAAGFVLGMLILENLLYTLFLLAVFNLAAAVIFDGIRTRRLETFRFFGINKRIITLFQKCIPLVIFMFLLSLENLIPKSVLESLKGAEALGIYSSIASPTLVVQVFASMVFNPFLPGFTRLYVENDMKRFRKMLHQLYLLMVCMGVGVTIGAILIGRWGLTLLFGTDILKYYNLFMPIVWCTILTAAVWIFSAIIVAMRKIMMLLAGMMVDFLIIVLGTSPVIRMYGMNGTSIIQLIALSVLIIYMIVIFEVSIHPGKESTEEER